MFCPKCGASLPENAIRCDQCGHTFAPQLNLPDSGAFKGFFIMVVSYFTMPLKTLRLMVAQLREVGSRGALDMEHTNLPHLTWLAVASKVVASIAIVVALLWGISKGIMSLGDLKYNAKDALLGLVMYPIGGVIIAAALDWALMIIFELLSLMVNIANDIRRMAEQRRD